MANADDMALFEEQAKVADPEALVSAENIVTQMAMAEIEVLDIETKLEEAQKRLNRLRTYSVPEVMAKANTSDFTIADGQFKGVKAEIKDFVSGSLPKDGVKRAAAIKWLEDNGHGEIVQDVLIVPMPKAKQNDVHRLMDELKEQGYSVERTSNVHAMTLQATARERLKNGAEVAAEILGLYVGRVAKLVWPKVKRGAAK